jgi:c-di-GMP-binding flagellar brake protein YcgR
MSSERRQYKRIPMGATVAFQEISFVAKEPVQAQTSYRDVSIGGLLVSSPREVSLGTLMKLEIRVPGWGKHQREQHFATPSESEMRPLVAVGEVVRVESLDSGQYELGIKFLNVYPDDRAALLKCIEASSTSDAH